MKKIIFTQRSQFNQTRKEYVDVLDQQFSALFSNDFCLIPMPNRISNVVEFVENVGCEGVVLTGGNSTMESDLDYCQNRSYVQMELLKYTEKKNIPTLGICYGMQFINKYLGGEVLEVSHHINTKHLVSFGEMSIEVNSFHKHGILKEGLAPELIEIAQFEDNTIESFIHRSLPWLGIMWHPERASSNPDIWVNLVKDIFLSSMAINEKNIIEYLKKLN